MPTTGIIKAKDIGFYVSQDSGTSYELIGFAQSGEFNAETSMTDVTTDDSGNSAAFIPDLNSYTFSTDGLVQYEAASGKILAYELLDLQIAQTLVKMKYTTNVTGDRQLTIDAYIQNVSESKSRGEAASFSVSMQCTGDPTHGTVSA